MRLHHPDVDINRSDLFKVYSTSPPRDYLDISDKLEGLAVGMHREGCLFEVLGAGLS
jgi:hypothetical protein